MKKTKTVNCDQKNNIGKMADKGFTLVELIIVIAIMMVLATAVAISFIKYVEKSRKSNCINTRKAMEKEYIMEKTEIEAKRENEGDTSQYTLSDYISAHPEYHCEDHDAVYTESDSGTEIICSEHGSIYND